MFSPWLIWNVFLWWRKAQTDLDVKGEILNYFIPSHFCSALQSLQDTPGEDWGFPGGGSGKEPDFQCRGGKI